MLGMGTGSDAGSAGDGLILGSVGVVVTNELVGASIVFCVF